MATKKKARKASKRKTQGAAAEWVDIGVLTPWSDNPRRNAHAIEIVAGSISRFGFGAPIVARKANGEIIAGHTRYEAAKRLGLKTIPVRYMDISEEDAHRLAIADNKDAEIAEWDEEKLSKVLGELADLWTDGLNDLGFSDVELSTLLPEIGLPDELPSGEIEERDSMMRGTIVVSGKREDIDQVRKALDEAASEAGTVIVWKAMA